MPRGPLRNVIISPGDIGLQLQQRSRDSGFENKERVQWGSLGAMKKLNPKRMCGCASLRGLSEAWRASSIQGRHAQHWRDPYFGTSCSTHDAQCPVASKTLKQPWWPGSLCPRQRAALQLGRAPSTLPAAPPRSCSGAGPSGGR